MTDTNRKPNSLAREGRLSVAPALDPTLQRAAVPRDYPAVDASLLKISLLAILLGGVVTAAAELLQALIALVTNLSFHGRLDWQTGSPLGHGLGIAVIGVPVLGGLVVGVMARFGSPGIRGHGIPEAMEQALHQGSRIPARMTFLKPISSAVAIGTGGPFGAEGPIIATGGALGSLVGQVLHTTALERRALLACGAAAGMAATFGTPFAAIALAIELLLFELRGRSLIPVTLASATAASLRVAIHGTGPVFPVPIGAVPSLPAFLGYLAVGALVGLAAVLVTRLVYRIEDGFARLPVHWMWWPALGGIVVGVVGFLDPRTLGVGYENIQRIASGDLAIGSVAILASLKLLSWSVALGSGTSGGTLAPLLTVGSGGGLILGVAFATLLPTAGMDPSLAAVVGMSAMFGGASHAMLASALFAFESTHEPAAVLPVLGGTAAAYLISSLLLRQSIMTEKTARRGVPIPTGYGADYLEQVLVREVALRPTVQLRRDMSLADVRRWLSSREPGTDHQGFPVIDRDDRVCGVVTRRDLLDLDAREDSTIADLVKRGPAVIFDDSTLREAADHMVRENVGRLPVVTRLDHAKVVGIITRSDLLGAHRARLDDSDLRTRSLGPWAMGSSLWVPRLGTKADEPEQ